MPKKQATSAFNLSFELSGETKLVQAIQLTWEQYNPFEIFRRYVADKD